MSLSDRQRRQIEAYRKNVGDTATERQLKAQRRCTYCFGPLPNGHSRGCRYYRSQPGRQP